jgi:hypothetical protein
MEFMDTSDNPNEEQGYDNNLEQSYASNMDEVLGEPRSVLDLPNDNDNPSNGYKKINHGSIAAIAVVIISFLVTTICITIGSSQGSLNGGIFAFEGIGIGFAVLVIGAIIAAIIDAACRHGVSNRSGTYNEDAYVARDNGAPEQLPVLGVKKNAPSKNRSVLDTSDRGHASGPLIGLIIFVIILIIALVVIIFGLSYRASRISNFTEALDERIESYSNDEAEDY